MIKAIFFDVDGVIVNNFFRGGVANYEKEMNVSEGVFYKIVHELPEWKQFTLGKISQEDYLKACEKNNPENYPFDSKMYIDRVLEKVKVNNDVLGLIEELSKNFTIGVICNHPKEWFKYLFEKIGLSDIIKIKAVSGFLGLRKPSKEIFQKALDLANVSPNESVYVDDRQERLGGAKELGVNTILFSGDIEKLKADILKFNK